MEPEFRTREELSRILKCDVKTLRRRLRDAGFNLDRGRISVRDWNDILRHFLGDDYKDAQDRPEPPKRSQTLPERNR